MDKPIRPDRDALLELNRSVTIARLFSGAVHDVNNALQVISGSIEVLDGLTDLPAPVTRALTRMRTQSTRAATTLERVTAFTRGPLDERAVLDLGDVVRVCVALREFAVKRARLSLDFVEEGDGPRLVAGTAASLEQAILNLIINAEQALAERMGTIRIIVSAGEGKVLIRVTDDGAGIQPERADRLFEPFAGDTVAHTAGLGLWAARQIAEAHGGTLVREAHSPGASFLLTLPEASRQKMVTS